MTHKTFVSRSMSSVAVGILLVLAHVRGWTVERQESRAGLSAPAADHAAAFNLHVNPLLHQYCVRCHNADNMESGIRVDQLAAVPEDRQIALWKDILQQVADGNMPPADEPQPTAEQRRLISEWITGALTAARSRITPKNGSLRRLTVAQYRNTLRDLLGLEEDLTDVLPPDGISGDGFANNGQTMVMSPLQVESCFDIAERSLELCIVDESTKPVIQTFRMDFGSSINPTPCPDNLVLGANSALLGNADFVVTELKPSKPFEYQPFAMQTAYRFIEGYVGNDTIRAWKEFDSIYHSVFACMRGSPGYPKGSAFQVVPNGLLLRPAIPSPEIFGQSDTYGPMANFKISLRELPDRGNFRVTVKAARYDDALLLDAGTPVSGKALAAGQGKIPAAGTQWHSLWRICHSVEQLSQLFRARPDEQLGTIVPQSECHWAGAVPLTEANETESPPSTIIADLSASPAVNVTIRQDGIYQVDVFCAPGESQGLLSLELGERQFAGQLLEQVGNTAEQQTAFMIVRLRASELKLTAQYGDNARLRCIVFTRLDDVSEPARRFRTFEQRSPRLGVHLGLRRDCGSTLTQVGGPRPVPGSELQEFVFEGAINDFPTPEVEQGNVNYLAGIREIGVRSEYTDGRDMPRLLVRSVEFEGPLYASWPPATHRSIFIESPHKNDPAVYAQEVINSFATRAFRRPVTATELESIFGVWTKSFAEKREARRTTVPTDPHGFGDLEDFRQSIRDALLVVLTSPQFLFLIENSSSPDAEPLDGFELASKLSYFLWNAPPDQRLLDLAAKDGRSRTHESSDESLTTSATGPASALHQSLDAEIERMIHDPRFGQFLSEFVTQWLSLDKFDVVAVDTQRYPTLTRDTRTQLRQEPVQFLRHLIEQNLPLRNVVQSDFLLANEVVASYYNLADRTESGFQFVPIRHENERLGGVLTQAGILAGLSDGRESNPIKRGAWLARKIIAEPLDDPPPNVPQLKEDDSANLTLREKLERHRSQKGCAKCHAGIDPWGIPFESFDAGGLWKNTSLTESRSTLPDGTEVQDLNGLKAYLAEDRIDQVAFSFLKHSACYAVGRSLTWNELMFLQEQCVPLKAHDYRLQELLRFVIKSDLFLKK